MDLKDCFISPLPDPAGAKRVLGTGTVFTTHFYSIGPQQQWLTPFLCALEMYVVKKKMCVVYTYECIPGLVCAVPEVRGLCLQFFMF